MTPQPLQKESLEALDELYNFVDGLDPDFIIRERISIIKSRIQDTRSRPHTPAPEPDEKCEICENPLEYHNNAYRWCKNMHSFRYFQTPHTSTPAPSELAATAYQAGIECGREEGATQAREDVLDELAQMYANVPEQFLEGTYRLHSEWKEKIESLRHGQKQEQQGTTAGGW